jgi:hypothetical protein
MTPAFTLLGACTVAVLLYAAHRRYGLPGVGKAQPPQLPAGQRLAHELRRARAQDMERLIRDPGFRMPYRRFNMDFDEQERFLEEHERGLVGQMRDTGLIG